MWKAMTHRAAHRRGPHLATLFATLLTAAACLGLAPAADAGDDETTARDLTVEQTSVFSLQAPLPAATAADGLNVVAWVDHADNTYAIGEAVRLFVRANKDAYLTVLNVGPTGNTTLLFPQRLPEGLADRRQPDRRDPGSGLRCEHPGERAVGGAGADQGDRLDQPATALRGG